MVCSAANAVSLKLGRRLFPVPIRVRRPRKMGRCYLAPGGSLGMRSGIRFGKGLGSLRGRNHHSYRNAEAIAN
jgi:hypothetical protein